MDQSTSLYINRKKACTEMAKYIRKKALRFGNEVVYIKGENVVAENPATGKVKILRKAGRKSLR